MKILVIIITTITILLVYTSVSSKNLEGNSYIIIKKIDNIEIREYKKLIYASYTPKSINDRNNSFKNIAGYIFGNNEKSSNIDMTSPVVIKLHNKNEMAFIMPEEYTLDNLPEPNNNNIKIYEQESNTKAVISYSGYSNEKIEKRKIDELKKKLIKHKIEYKNDFEVLIYNAPYQLLNRKNEISVSIDYIENKTEEVQNKNLKRIYFGGGCFWCIEAIFEDVIGVTSVSSGYSGGEKSNPSYLEVSNGLTNHAEVCEIIYDDKKIKLKDLLEIFFLSHDPTTINKQGNDIGSHYRSIILYNSINEKREIKNYIDNINKEFFSNKIVTELKRFNQFYKAEDYHQDYFKNNQSASYCQLVISPKLMKAKTKLRKYYK